MEKTKKILIKKAKSEFFKWFWFLDYEKKDLKVFIDEIKSTKTQKQLDKITYNLFHK